MIPFRDLPGAEKARRLVDRYGRALPRQPLHGGSRRPVAAAGARRSVREARRSAGTGARSQRGRLRRRAPQLWPRLHPPRDESRGKTRRRRRAARHDHHLRQAERPAAVVAERYRRRTVVFAADRGEEPAPEHAASDRSQLSLLPRDRPARSRLQALRDPRRRRHRRERRWNVPWQSWNHFTPPTASDWRTSRTLALGYSRTGRSHGVPARLRGRLGALYEGARSAGHARTCGAAERRSRAPARVRGARHRGGGGEFGALR